MVKVTISYITKKGSLNAPKHGRDTKEHVSKLTHLYLNDQFIDGIGDISACKSLKVLYLQSNLLTAVENLSFASNLTHLYLQRNKLCKIQGFEALHSLRKLYLGYNLISVVEGLERTKCLNELHIEHQQIPSGEELTFDPRSVAAIGQSLEFLNLEDNGLTSLEDLVGLEVVKILNVSNNNLSDVTKIQAFLSAVPSLFEIDIRGNPVISDYKNCNKIVASTHNLQVFNGKEIPDSTLEFVKKLESRQMKVAASRTVQPVYDLRATFTELSHDLPEALAKDLAKDVTSCILQNEAISKKVAENVSELQPSSDIQMNAPYYHFPAFKSSTCLHFEGHAIPRQFHRLAKKDPLLGRCHRSTKVLFPKESDNTGVKSDISIPELVSKHIGSDTFNSNLTTEILNRGDMVWGNRP